MKVKECMEKIEYLLRKGRQAVALCEETIADAKKLSEICEELYIVTREDFLNETKEFKDVMKNVAKTKEFFVDLDISMSLVAKNGNEFMKGVASFHERLRRKN